MEMKVMTGGMVISSVSSKKYLKNGMVILLHFFLAPIVA